jgi:heme oxygenase
MSAFPSPSAQSRRLFPYLKDRTAAHHRRLENRLGLLLPPISPQRVIRVLARFAAFHRVWEPAIARQRGFEEIMKTRGRGALAERDLVMLGVSVAERAGLCCEAARDLVVDSAGGMGSVYVMEGATLGSQIIGRVLGREDWVPPGGLWYFSPPGRDVRADWIALQSGAEAVWDETTWPAIAAGALRTFEFLDQWLTEGDSR